MEVCAGGIWLLISNELQVRMCFVLVEMKTAISFAPQLL